MSLIIDAFSILFILLAISATGSSNIKAILAVFLFGLIVIEWKGKIELNSLIKSLFLFLVLVTLEIFLSGNIPIDYILSRFSMFFPIILCMYYSKRENRGKIIQITVLIWALVALRATFLMMTGTLNARSLAAHLESSIPFSGGGYALAIGSALLGAFLFDLLIWNKVSKLFGIPMVILLSYVVVLTQSTTTLVALIAGFLSSIILRLARVSRLRGLNKKQFFSVMLVVLICVGIVFLKDHIGNLIISFAYGKKDILSRRLVEFGSILSDSTSIIVDSSDSDGRFLRLLRSLNIFFEHPIFGVTAITGTDHYIQSAYGIGSHGELFDALARFGIVAGIPYLNMFFRGLTNVRKEMKFECGFGYFITFCVLFIFNPCLYMSINIVIFFIMPLMILEKNKIIEVL